MVILGKTGVGVDVEILTRGTRTALASQTTRLAAAVLAAVWIVLLITVPGVKLNIWL